MIQNKMKGAITRCLSDRIPINNSLSGCYKFVSNPSFTSKRSSSNLSIPKPIPILNKVNEKLKYPSTKIFTIPSFSVTKTESIAVSNIRCLPLKLKLEKNKLDPDNNCESISKRSSSVTILIKTKLNKGIRTLRITKPICVKKDRGLMKMIRRNSEVSKYLTSMGNDKEVSFQKFLNYMNSNNLPQNKEKIEPNLVPIMKERPKRWYDIRKNLIINRYYKQTYVPIKQRTCALKNGHVAISELWKERFIAKRKFSNDQADVMKSNKFICIKEIPEMG